MRLAFGSIAPDFAVSPDDKLAKTRGCATPFDLVPDPDKKIIRAYTDSLEAADIVNAWRAPQRSAVRARVELLLDLMAMGAAL